MKNLVALAILVWPLLSNATPPAAPPTRRTVLESPALELANALAHEAKTVEDAAAAAGTIHSGTATITWPMNASGRGLDKITTYQFEIWTCGPTTTTPCKKMGVLQITDQAPTSRSTVHSYTSVFPVK